MTARLLQDVISAKRLRPDEAAHSAGGGRIGATQGVIVSRDGANGLVLAEFHQWGEPLEDGFTRSLAENLGFLLGSQRVVTFPWKRAEAVDVQVVLRVTRFEALTDEARLTLHWSLVRDRETLLATGSHLVAEIEGEGHAALVAAMSTTVEELAGEVAAAIHEIN